jgi:glucose/galactose transporter
MGICNKIAGILAPILIGTFVLHGMGDIANKVAAVDAAGKVRILDDFAASIHVPYLLMAGVLATTGAAILFSPLPDVRAEHDNGDDAGAGGGLFRFPHVWLGALAIFVYVGAEVMAGDAIGTYGRGFDIPLDVAKYFTSGTLGCMLIGYLVGFVTIPRFVSQQSYLAVSASLGILFTLGAFLTHGYVSVGFVAALGFANAMMWPAIFPLAIHGLGRLIERGSALLIMGIAGGAIIPQAFAYLKQSYDFQTVFLALTVPCYLYIWYFATRGFRAGQPATLAVARTSR